MPTVEDLSGAEIVDGVVEAPSAPPLSPPVLDPVKTADPEDDEDDEDIDESIMERLLALTEMFPESIRNVTSGVFGVSVSASQWLYKTGRIGLWVAASSATILALPIMFETERSQMEGQQLAQQRQILLGPNAAVSGGAGGMGIPAPPIR